ncbi:30S ribosomal protein S13 [Candidatus Woesearchaeota archaeon]|nr:30S ribosomal protein S13 [Candidatus Woesearchaeota archaeon]
MAEEKSGKPDYKHIIRVANTDLDGAKPLQQALTKVKGVGFMMAKAVCLFSKVDRNKQAGKLNETEVSRLNEVLSNPVKSGIPTWMINRRKDPETGGDIHFLGADLRFNVDNDKKVMKKIKSYKGVRHMSGLPVRGQKTKSNFRRNKGKSLGVQRKKGAKKGK